MNPHLLAFAGYHGCGKTTAAGYLDHVRRFAVFNFSARVRYGLQGALNLPVTALWNQEKTTPLPGVNKTPRELMQWLGEAGRQLDPDLWVRLLVADLQVCRRDCPTRPLVVDDLRRLNELEALRALGFVTIRIDRDGLVPSGDVSESEIHLLPVDYVLPNNGTREEFLARLDALVAHLSV